MKSETSVHGKRWLVCGLVLIGLGALSNEWTLGRLTVAEGYIAWQPLRVTIWLAQIMLIGSGVLIVCFRHSSLPPKLVMALISIIASLFIAEGLLRLIDRLPVDGPDYRRAQVFYEFQRTTQHHPEWGWTFRPNVDARWNEGWRGREKSDINNRYVTRPIPGYPYFGMRDDGLNERAESVIPVFGDSFTFGSTVEAEETWVEVIEERHPRLDLLNLASGGGLTKAVAQYDILRDLLPHHDTVVYAMWMGNEFADNWAFPRGVERSASLAVAHDVATQRWRIEAASRLAYVVGESVFNLQRMLGAPPDELNYLPEGSGLWDDRFGNFNLHPANPILTRYAEPIFEDSRIEEGIENTEKAMAEMKILAGDRRLVIIMLPFKEQLYDDLVLSHRPELQLDRPNAIVSEMCRRRAVSCYDLLPELRPHQHEKLYWDYDPHFTKEGQRLAALTVERLIFADTGN